MDGSIFLYKFINCSKGWNKSNIVLRFYRVGGANWTQDVRNNNPAAQTCPICNSTNLQNSPLQKNYHAFLQSIMFFISFVV